MGLRVLHIHVAEGHAGGGGGISMTRLHERLVLAGIDSKVLCLHKTSKSAEVALLPRVRGERVLQKATGRLGLNDVHRLGSFRLGRHAFYRDADIVHFHCTHSGAFSYLALPAVSRKKPCVFSLHDMWAMTGHCGYSYDCRRWESGCGRCPYPDENPKVARDATRVEWRLKRWAFRRSNVTFISKCRWLTSEARRSIIGRLPVYEIPCGIDTDVFVPLDRAQCRELLRIPTAKHVLLFVAQWLESRRKGGDLLLEALRHLPEGIRSDTVLLVMGRGGNVFGAATGIRTVDLGYIDSDRMKALAYSAADLFLFPTRADVFGLVSIESQACGTPVVSFRVGGVPDHVRPNLTGYLAEPEDWRDFRDGIVSLLEDETLRSSMRARCREIAVAEYGIDLEVERHLELYDRLAGRGTAGSSSRPSA